MFGFGSRDKSQLGFIQKMNQSVQNAIQNLFKVRWSALPRRAATAYLDLFHTSPRLDALDMIATDCANAVFKVYRKADLRTGKEDAEPIGDHPIYDLLENPIPDHPEFDGFMVRYLTTVYVELNGECFWVILRDQKGRPREIYPVPSQWCIQTPTAAQPWYLIVPLQNTAGASMQIDPRDIVWFKNPDAVSPYGRGRGRTESIGDELESDEYAAKFGKNFFYNNATPEAVMTIPGINDASLKAFKADWNAAHQGIINASKMGFLGFDAKIQKLQDSPKEMDFIATREFLRDMTNQHWRVPPEMMGILNNSNRATIESADYLYKKNVVSPRLIRWDTTVNRQLMPMWGVEWAIKSENVVPEDKEFNLKVASEGWTSGALSRDQWLIMNGKPAIGGEFGSQYLVPFNMVAVTPASATASAIARTERDVTPQPEAIEETEEQAGAVEPNDDADDQTQPVGTTNELPITPQVPAQAPAKSLEKPADVPQRRIRQFTPDQRTAIWKTFDKTAEKTEPLFESAVKRFAGTQKAAFQKAFNTQIDAGKSVKDAADRATLAVFNPKIDDALKTALTPGWLASMKAGEEHATAILGKKKGKGAKAGTSGAFDVSNPKFLEWIQAHGLEKAKGMNDTTLDELKKQLQTELAEAIDEGASSRDMAKIVMDVSDGVWENMDTVRANAIARTESAATVNYGTKETYRGEGIQKKEWLSIDDDRTRDTHLSINLPANPYIIGIDEEFQIGGDSMEYPGGGSDAAENVNCRCTILPVIDEGEE